MVIDAFKEFKFLFNKLPFQIIFYPTSRCNALCDHCYNYERQDNASRDNELSLEEINRISLYFDHIKALTISGGEPFLRKDIKEIVEIFYKNNGLQYVSVHSNAFLKEIVIQNILGILRNLPNLKVIFCVSIDGIGDLHDRVRGVTSGFDKMIATVQELENIKKSFNSRLFLLSSTVFSHSTQANCKETISFIKKKFKAVKPAVCFIRGDVRDNKEKEIDQSFHNDFIEVSENAMDKSINAFSPMALKETLEWMTGKLVLNNHLHQSQTIPCQAGRKLIVIYENGDVYPCELLKKKFGNLRDVNYDIKKLLFSEEGKLIKRKINPGKTCHCTWENIMSPNLLSDIRSYHKIIYNWFRLFVFNKERMPCDKKAALYR